MTSDERARMQARSVAEMPTRPVGAVLNRRAAPDPRAAEAPTKLLARAAEPFERAVGIAHVVRTIAELDGELERAAQTDDARSLLRECNARRCAATGLATTAALAVTPESARAELRAELHGGDAVLRFDTALTAMQLVRDARPHAFVEAQAAVRDAQRTYADGAFAALDGAPCTQSGVFAAGHRNVARWLRDAPTSVAMQIVRDARLDRDGGYWARLRSAAVDASRFEISAAYRAGVIYAEQVLASRGQL